MTVLDPKSTRIVIADGFSTFYPFGFTLTDNFALFVAIDGEDPGKYKISDTGITFSSPPPRGARIVIQRLTDLTQLIDWVAFGPFPAQDTEDATDKLIILKEEAIAFRAGLNLVTVRRVGTVTIVSDKGTDAEFSLWGPEMAGFYNALASAQNMPAPGTIVDKPEQFMYWQWDSGQIEPPDPDPLGAVLTSSPYPYYLFESVAVSADVEFARAVAIQGENLTLSWSVEDGTLRVILKEHTPEPESITMDWTVEDSTLREILKSYTSQPESITMDWAVEDSTLRPLLVTNTPPPEVVAITYAIEDSILEAV